MGRFPICLFVGALVAFAVGCGDSGEDCESAIELAPLFGDISPREPRTVSGAGSRWYAIEFQESRGGLSDFDHSFTVTLDAPPGTAYRLQVTHDEEEGERCAGSLRTAEVDGDRHTAEACWDDIQGFGGHDDIRWLSISVEQLSGDESAGEWQLTIDSATLGSDCS